MVLAVAGALGLLKRPVEARVSRAYFLRPECPGSGSVVAGMKVDLQHKICIRRVERPYPRDEESRSAGV